MLPSALIKISNLLEYTKQYFLFKLLSFNKASITKDTLLLVRLDSIGDYVLLRNFIRLLKESNKYKNYRVTLCGNIIWKELAETLDSDSIDKFLWLDRKKFKSSVVYKYNFLKEIKMCGFETTVDLTYSREILFGDAIVKASNASERIGSEGSLDSYVWWKRKLFSDRYYTKLIPASKKNLFEFYRNKEFFQSLLEVELKILNTSIDVSKIVFNRLPSDDYVVIVPGASENKKMWNLNYFIDTIEFLMSKFSYKIILTGSEKEKVLAKKITSAFEKNLIDLTGKTTLSQLARLLSSAKLLISNDTSAIHFAAAVNTPFICICNGNRFGRFHPYPNEIFDKGFFVYPSEIMNNLNNVELLNEKYRFNSDLNINDVKPEAVEELVTNILNI
jgi:ADP-heptose:LPS heptosyltransferase